jgi:hypothetical protein
MKTGYLLGIAFTGTMCLASGQPWWLAGTAVFGLAGWLDRRRSR